MTELDKFFFGGCRTDLDVVSHFDPSDLDPIDPDKEAARSRSPPNDETRPAFNHVSCKNMKYVCYL